MNMNKVTVGVFRFEHNKNDITSEELSSYQYYLPIE